MSAKAGSASMFALALLVGLWCGSLEAQETTEQDDREQTEPVTPIPPITDTDRASAFPDVEPHRLRGDAVYAFALLEQLEWNGGTTEGFNWDATAWVGGVRNRLWFRTEGQADGGDLADAEAHLLYGRAVARWWDVVVGVRQDIRPGPAQSWAAVGVQGLAPYWFELEMTGYIGDRGRTAARLEADYELLFTNRLILRPRVELNLYGKRHAARGIGAGLATTDAGLRLRYEFRRELAPYIGVSWRRTYGETRELVERSGTPGSHLQFVAGARLWY